MLPVDKLLVHEDYDRVTFNNDILLLRLSIPAPEQYPPVKLYSGDSRLLDGDSFTIVGWGQRGFYSRASNYQEEVEVDFVERTDCAGRYSKASAITSNMMCAAREGADACRGDSGGPLLLLGNGTAGTDVQVGIVSFGAGCGDVRYPGVYTDIGALRGWIVQSLANWGIQLPCDRS